MVVFTSKTKRIDWIGEICMIKKTAKSYRLGELEIIMNIRTDGLYNVAQKSKDTQSVYVSNLKSYEDADDVYEYLVDMALERDK
jgi:hypothetical protein